MRHIASANGTHRMETRRALSSEHSLKSRLLLATNVAKHRFNTAFAIPAQ